MSEKRKDNKGRILRTGESQRKDLIYQYRYTDSRGNRQTVYSSDLKNLREKEEEIQKNIYNGVDYVAGKITLVELAQKYVDLKQGVKYNTKVAYRQVLQTLQKWEIGARPIKNIKSSDLQQWFINLHTNGSGYRTIEAIYRVIRPAFKMAYNEGAISKSPATFRVADIIPNTSKSREALTEAQQRAWLEFVRTDPVGSKHYDECVVLLGTGMRVSEFCGLTKDDIDFQNQEIRIDHQLLRKNGGVFIEGTKSASGQRSIPMTEDVAHSLKNILSRRQEVKIEAMVDGYSGFVFVGGHGKPKYASLIQHELRSIMKRYRDSHPDDMMPAVTPHVLRHTFCSNMARAGMNVKSLQYIMGHSNVGITMNVYAHVDHDYIAEQMHQIYDKRRPS